MSVVCCQNTFDVHKILSVTPGNVFSSLKLSSWARQVLLRNSVFPLTFMVIERLGRLVSSPASSQRRFSCLDGVNKSVPLCPHEIWYTIFSVHSFHPYLQTTTESYFLFIVLSSRLSSVSPALLEMRMTIFYQDKETCSTVFQSHRYNLYSKQGFVVMRKIQIICTSQIVSNTILLQFWKEVDYSVT